MEKVKNILKKIAYLLPSKLPTGTTEFHQWADSIINTYDMPTKDIDSLKFSLAAIVVNLGPQTLYKPKYYFYLTILSGAAKQVAGSIFTEIKENQRQALLKAQSENAEAKSQ